MPGVQRLFRLSISQLLICGIVCVMIYWLYLSFQPPQRSFAYNLQPLASYILVPSDEHSPETGRNGKVPKIIHQTWRDYKIPTLMEPWLKKCIGYHPDWEYWFWTDQDIHNLVEQHFPDYLALFDSYPASGYRADVFRYLVLYHFGGVYLDLDVECLKPLDPIIEEHNCILSQEPLYHAHFLSPMHIPLVSNAIMACRRLHPFFGHVIKDLHSYTGWFKWNDILRSTGPYMLTEIYKGYIRGGLFSTPDPIYLADPDEFQPTTDPSMRDHMREACIHSEGKSFPSQKFIDRQKELCTNIMTKGFRDKPGPESYTDHHWTHTWAGRRNDPYGIMNSDASFDVTSLSENKEKLNLLAKKKGPNSLHK